jgi:hypothetical protein
MYKKLALFSVFVLSFSGLSSCSYMNDKEITFRTILTGDCCTSIDYNILNDGDGHIGGVKRMYGIHNMFLTIPGYETVHLIKDDVCLHPYLFTILNNLFARDNMFVQRWACVKWFLPLSFGFKVENGLLTINSSIWKYKFLSLFRANETIQLVKNAKFDASIDDKDLTISVTVNGRTAEVAQKTVLQIYSLSALDPYAVLARMLFL